MILRWPLTSDTDGGGAWVVGSAAPRRGLVRRSTELTDRDPIMLQHDCTLRPRDLQSPREPRIGRCGGLERGNGSVLEFQASLPCSSAFARSPQGSSWRASEITCSSVTDAPPCRLLSSAASIKA